MVGRRMAWLGWVTLTLVLGPGAAAAQVPARVTVEGTGACPEVGALERRFAANDADLARQPGTDPAVPAREFRVRVEGDAGAPTGVLTVTEPDGTHSERRLRGTSCAEVLDALALVVSVLWQSGAPEAAPASRASGAPERDADAPDALAEAPPGLAPGLFVGATLAIGGGEVPGPALLPRAFVGVELGPRGAATVWASLRLSLAYAAATEEASGTGVAFETLAGRADGCGPRVGDAWLGLEGCATLSLGHLQGEVVGLGDADARWDGPWLAAGLLGRFVILALSPLRLEVEAGAFTPLRSHRFSFTRSQEVVEAWRTPDVGGFVGISAGLTIL